MRQAGARGGERPAHVDLMHEIEALHRRIARAGQADGAGVVDQDVDPAEAFDGAGDRLLDLALVAYVDGTGQRVTIEFDLTPP